MKVVNSRLEEAATEAGAIVAAGFFDGLHLGHRAVLGAALGAARSSGVEAWAFTFASHPRAFLSPASAPPLLMAPDRRLAALEAMGFDGACLVEFDAAVAALPPAEFANRLGLVFPALREVRCGANWRFGRGGAGTPEELAALGRGRGWDVVAAPVAEYAGAPVSSTRIRAAVADGDLEAAAAMLGRPFSISGVVGHGRRVGTAGGAPTANIATDGLATPPTGVYAVEATLGDAALRGVADLGWRPTFPDARPAAPVLEVHLFDVGRDLYGERLEVTFLKRLRGEIAFPTKEALFRQIAADIEAARALP